MSKQVTTKTPKLFIGLDIHKKSWRFHFTTDLFSGSGHTFPAGTELILKYVLKNYADYEVSIAYEVGCFGYKPARDFESFGWDTYVVNPADIPRPSKSKFMKTDKIDPYFSSRRYGFSEVAEAIFRMVEGIGYGLSKH